MVYTEQLRSSTTTYHVAVTASLQEDFPTLPQLFRILAQSPSGCLRLYLGPKERCKTFKNKSKAARKQACVLCRPGEEQDAKGCTQLYSSPQKWLLGFDASVEAMRWL